MDVFRLRDRLIKDYADYIQSFILIQDDQIQNHVEANLKAGFLWPDPLIQLNPSFEPGEWIDELVNQGILHDECRQIFRIKQDPQSEGYPLRLHKHQSKAIKAAKTGSNYVLTTGTGSGKSLAYIIPIVDHVLRRGTGKGIQAIIIYPMNALCNSQYGELEKFLRHGYLKDSEPVRFAKYTGQEKDEERQAIIAHPPDILLTNYMMLELILTRPIEKNIVETARDLKFLVLDELHTYRGRQGADIAMLVRRLRDACEADALQCIGTSATLAGPGTYEEQRIEIASMAKKLFGGEVEPEMVIGETLRKATPETDLTDPLYLNQLKDRISDSDYHSPPEYQAFIKDPLSIWIENTFGITSEKGTGRLLRARPKSLTGEEGAAKQLNEKIGISEERCIEAIREGLLGGYCCTDPETGFPTFAFRLHQFISRGDSVYASLDPEDSRYVTVYGQQFVPGDRSRVLLPIVFCRECGQEYYCIRQGRDPESRKKVFTARNLPDRYHDEFTEAGFLFRNNQRPWPEQPEELFERLPIDWLEEHRGTLRVRKNRRPDLPQPVFVDLKGQESDQGIAFLYLKAPFRFCLNCGVSYGARQVSDIGKLTSLGTEGRSTATTILSLSAIHQLKKEESLPEKARKLLSFTDNRQDASLQAGHFNDFIEVGLLRSALFRAAKDVGPDGLTHDQLTHKVFDALDLPLHLYATDPDVRFHALEETKKALRNVIGYRLYHDLRRGWRVTSPNLEQCGLLEINYPSLQELCSSDEEWINIHPALVTAPPETRFNICKVLLNHLRQRLAIKVDYLETSFQERIQQQSNQRLISPWAIDENEKMTAASILFPRAKQQNDYEGNEYLSPRGNFGQYLRRSSTISHYRERVGLEETQTLIIQLLQTLKVAGLVEEIVPAANDTDVPGYQIPGDALRWIAGDGTQPFHDPLRVLSQSDRGGRTNPFFVEFYKGIALEGKGLEAREHTAQVKYELREEREEAFREGRLPVLYCSPTMELGIDISTLNLVNMRNIPPTPANYVQRSGRAGRSGQPALVFSYCTTGSPHDQYYFKRPDQMVAGAVSPPRLDLANEDLIMAHVYAVWLAATGQSLGSSLRDILDLNGENPTLSLLPSVMASIQNPRAREHALERCRNILATIDEEGLKKSDWYSSGWLNEILSKVTLKFDQTCNRWRSLYRAAAKQREIQHKIISDASRSPDDKRQAKRLRREAEAQMELLLESGNVLQSDFYSYRYFASEGFLPGYNFPRLPLSAYIPGRQGRRDDFLSRPRFLAISEFGPRSIVYHEGSRYIINKVIMPVGEELMDDEKVLTTQAKLCPKCGYLHPIVNGGPGLDLCETCRDTLDSPLRSLFRLQNVSTKRRDRINCDEEERLRLGYEIKTGLRFAVHGGRPSFQTGTLVHPTHGPLATLTYGNAATLWRINLGWRRRASSSQLGFVLDTERGYWAKNESAPEEDEGDPLSPQATRVIPFVEDHRNCLLFKPIIPLEEKQMVSLQSALKQGLQTFFQLEDDELAAEPLPTNQDRRTILFYEAAEGGAGILRQLISNPNAFAHVAQNALDLCHFDPLNGEDQRKAPKAREDCEAACYDCLMNYGNQPDHPLLDRKLIKDLLLNFTHSKVSASPAEIPRAEHLKELVNQAESDLEEKWLSFLEERDLHLPSKAQFFFEKCMTMADFYYEDHLVLIYVDGPVHQYPDRAKRDQQQTDCLEDLGYSVIRFGHLENWEETIGRFPHVFGLKKKNE